MTVEELIKELLIYPQDARVYVRQYTDEWNVDYVEPTIVYQAGIVSL